MALDQTQNFVEVDITGTYTSSDTTISLESGGASEVPDPANGEYNLVWFDAKNNAKPSFDPEVEIVRVTGRDTNNDTLTVSRGQENTSAVAHDTSDADYKFLLTPTSKLVDDIDSANFSTNSLTVANTTISLGESGTPEVDNFNGNNGTSNQFLKTDGSLLSFDELAPNIDIGGQTSVTAASSDEVLIEDASDAAAKKKVTAQSIADLGGGVNPLDGVQYQTFFESLDNFQTVTSGSGSISDASEWITIKTGTTSGSTARLQFERAYPATVSSYTWDKDRSFAVGLRFNDVNGTLYVVTGELSDGNFDLNHAGFKATNGTLFGTVADNNSETTTTLISNFSTGSYRLRVEYIAGSKVEFYVDGTKEGEITSGVPSGTFGAESFFSCFTKNSTSNNRAIRVSSINMFQKP